MMNFNFLQINCIIVQ
ncbi:hypothetical protein BpHYR1_003236 [Brachionus plicatilis]|uniref:Uncharacterized protein n=1 Tax=Brachionus plicatilis TaxID=10195 RepID=A0A3M7Q1Q1_BRAPC|nr:hypothetical protein BpHYR1_003236 [Brachionus plicatilis]